MTAAHSFYGRSWPTEDWSTDNLQYLTSTQALADLDALASHVQKTYLGESGAHDGSAARPWIAFGGSYPGNLAAWVRLRYPSRFAGSIASSAPVHAEPNCAYRGARGGTERRRRGAG